MDWQLVLLGLDNEWKLVSFAQQIVIEFGMRVRVGRSQKMEVARYETLGDEQFDETERSIISSVAGWVVAARDYRLPYPQLPTA